MRAVYCCFSLGLLLAATACGSSEPTPPGPCGSLDALAALSDYASSKVGGFGLDGGTSFAAGVDLGSDPALSFSRGRAFYLARDLGRIFELDTRCGRPFAEWSANDANGLGSADPQDVAVAPDGALWVARYNVPSLLILAPGDAGPPRTVDLSGYDTDGNPQASAIRIVDDVGTPPAPKAFVALQRLDDRNMLIADKSSTMLRIDVATARVEAALTLAGRNPFGTTDVIGGATFLAEPGNFSVADEPFAGIERFDFASSTSKLLITKHDLGGSPAEVAVTAGCGVAVLAGASSVNATSLVSFDPDTGEIFAGLGQPILSTPGFFLQGLAWLGATVLVVGEGDLKAVKASVFHVFDRTAGCNLKERPLPLHLPLKPIAVRAASP